MKSEGPPGRICNKCKKPVAIMTMDDLIAYEKNGHMHKGCREGVANTNKKKNKKKGQA